VAIVAHVVHAHVARNRTMKLTKESLKQIIKEELEAVMNEQADSSGLEIELERAGARRQNPQRSANPGTFDLNNNYLAFDDGNRTFVFYIPNEIVSKELMALPEKFGFRQGSIAIKQSNYGAPKDYEREMAKKNPNRRVVGI